MPTPDYTPTATPPTAIGLASTTGTGAAPDQIPGAVPTATAATPGQIPGAALVPTADAPVAYAMPSTAGVIDTPRPRDYWPALPTPDDTNMLTPALPFAGQLLLNQVFGLFRAPKPCVVTTVQLSAQVVPQGADAKVTLVDAAGVSLGVVATLPAGESWAELKLGTPLNLLSDAVVRGKITQVGSTTPGSFLTVTLIVQNITA